MSRLNILNRSSRDEILESTSDIREIESEGVTENVGMEETTFGVNDRGVVHSSVHLKLKGEKWTPNPCLGITKYRYLRRLLVSSFLKLFVRNLTVGTSTLLY